MNDQRTKREILADFAKNVKTDDLEAVTKRIRDAKIAKARKDENARTDIPVHLQE